MSKALVSFQQTPSCSLQLGMA